MQDFALVPYLTEAFSEYTPTMLGAVVKRVLWVPARDVVYLRPRTLLLCVDSDSWLLLPSAARDAAGAELEKHALFVSL